MTYRGAEMATKDTDVTPNRRGALSREAVLDAAERVMAEHGFEGATLARVIEASGVPASSIYHYFGSKEGLLVAVMHRGAERFFAGLPELDELRGTPEEHLRLAVAALRAALEANPEFLRLMILLAAQPAGARAPEAVDVVRQVRDEGRRRLRGQYAIAFGEDEGSPAAERAAQLSLAIIDGTFVAAQADPTVGPMATLDLLPSVMRAASAGHT